MPDHLKALIVILGLAVTVFTFVKVPACALASATANFERRRNLWFAITLVAFLSNNIWICIVALAGLMLFAQSRESNRFSLFFFLLFAAPAIPAEIPGLGVIDHFFTVNYVRLLALTVLLPAFLSLRTQPGTEPFGRCLPDKLIAAYIALLFILQLRGISITNALRHGLFYAFIDVFLPYYVASRALKTLPAFRDALMSYVVAASVLAAIGAFEFAKGWLLYTSLDGALGTQWYAGAYMLRGESLRALGTTQQPIVLGYVMVVAMGFFLYLRKSVANPLIWGIGMAVLAVGLLAPVSRGPWVGAAAMGLGFILIGPSPGRRLAMLGLVSAFLLPMLAVTPVGQKIIDLVPFIGSVDAQNVFYRQRVLENSIQVILTNPLFGSIDFLNSPLIEDLRQGQGIIDIVNTYLAIGLSSGLVGLLLFCGFFTAIGISVLVGMKTLTDKNSELYLLGQVLLSTLLGILLVIFTASSISVVPIIYWSVAGLGVGYVNMLERRLATNPANWPPDTDNLRPRESRERRFRAPIPR